MIKKDSSEKRSRERLLCNVSFSIGKVKYKNNTYVVESINYHRYGMCLFSMVPIADVDKVTISFCYDDKNSVINIVDLPVLFRHRHETDVGNQYGIEFLISDGLTKVKDDLINIENLLKLSIIDDERYEL